MKEHEVYHLGKTELAFNEQTSVTLRAQISRVLYRAGL